MKWQVKEGISDMDLVSAVDEIKQGLIDASLVGCLIKKRVACRGSGKSSGYRTIIATNKNNRWFFLFGFAKKEKGNLTQQELQYLKSIGVTMIDLEEDKVKIAIKEKEIIEVCYE